MRPHFMLLYSLSNIVPWDVQSLFSWHTCRAFAIAVMIVYRQSFLSAIIIHSSNKNEAEKNTRSQLIFSKILIFSMFFWYFRKFWYFPKNFFLFKNLKTFIFLRLNSNTPRFDRHVRFRQYYDLTVQLR